MNNKIVLSTESSLPFQNDSSTIQDFYTGACYINLDGFTALFEYYYKDQKPSNNTAYFIGGILFEQLPKTMKIQITPTIYEGPFLELIDLEYAVLFSGLSKWEFSEFSDSSPGGVFTREFVQIEIIPGNLEYLKWCILNSDHFIIKPEELDKLQEERIFDVVPHYQSTSPFLDEWVINYHSISYKMCDLPNHIIEKNKSKYFRFQISKYKRDNHFNKYDSQVSNQINYIINEAIKNRKFLYEYPSNEFRLLERWLKNNRLPLLGIWFKELYDACLEHCIIPSKTIPGEVDFWEEHMKTCDIFNLPYDYHIHAINRIFQFRIQEDKLHFFDKEWKSIAYQIECEAYYSLISELIIEFVKINGELNWLLQLEISFIEMGEIVYNYEQGKEGPMFD